jgi:hypothetical protein
MFRVQILLLFLSLFYFQSFAQDRYIFKGVVRDADTNETLPFASVFLANTTFGTVSNEKGEFSLEVKNAGSYDLIVKFAGYATYARSFQIFEPQVIELNVQLTVETRFIGGVTVTAKKDEEWRRNLESFKKGFLGTSPFAEQCKILNEDKIDFYYDAENNVFEAFAKEPLIIENKALGYRIKYILEEYKVFNREHYMRFYGFPVFEELKEGKEPRKRWVKNREMAYHGSTDHFFSALFNNKLKEEGYKVQPARKEDGKMYLDKNEMNLSNFVSEGSNGNSKRLIFENWLYITYKGGKSRFGGSSSNGSLTITAGPTMTNNPISEMRMFEGKTFLEFESNGYVYNPLDFVVNGYWSNQKVGDLIPINYAQIREEN